MEWLRAEISDGTRKRMTRIKELRKQESGYEFDDSEIVMTAITHYWVETEKRIAHGVKTDEYKEVWIAWERWDNIVGIYSSRDQAIDAIKLVCKNPRHNDKLHDENQAPSCIVQKYELDWMPSS